VAQNSLFWATWQSTVLAVPSLCAGGAEDDRTGAHGRPCRWRPEAKGMGVYLLAGTVITAIW
jgi:hypothetical protein